MLAAIPRPQYRLEFAPGADSVRETLKVMRRLVLAGKKHPLVRAFAVALTQHLPQKDFQGEAAALFAFVRDGIRFVRDISGEETLHTADTVLRTRSGDCDDKSILLASLLESIEFPTRLRAVGYGGHCTHVYVCVWLEGVGWVGADATEPVPFGWEPRTPRVVQQIENADA